MHVEHIAADRSLDKHSMYAQRSKHRMSCRSNGSKPEYRNLLDGRPDDVRRHALVAPSANAPSRFRESIDGPFDRGTAHKQLYSAAKTSKDFPQDRQLPSFTLLHQHF